jgi:hypothetical protein
VAIGVILLVLLAVAAVLFVGLPFLRDATVEDEWRAASAEQLRRVELRERRDAAYVALRELELDHDTGKLDDADYATATAELRAEALAALAELGEDAAPEAAPEPVDATGRSGS